MGSKNLMRLSLKKGAHADLARAACRKFGVFATAYVGRKRWGEAHPLLFALRKKQTHLFRLRRRGQSTHHNQTKQRRKQSRKNSVPLCQQRRQVPLDRIKIPKKS